MKKFVKILVEVLLLALICGLVYLIYNSINQPVEFNKQVARREKVGIERLKDIRTLQTAYKSVNGKYTGSIDSLKNFYENGEISILMQVGSKDDSLAMAHTEKIKRTLRGKGVNLQLQQLYEAGDKNLVFSFETKVPVKDTLFNHREDFCIDSLKYIPFSGGQEIEMEAISRMVSGVQVPLFEARMPYKKLLKGLDNQLRINLDADCKDRNRYEGLQVGSVTTPNNNAGNWE